MSQDQVYHLIIGKGYARSRLQLRQAVEACGLSPTGRYNNFQVGAILAWLGVPKIKMTK